MRVEKITGKQISGKKTKLMQKVYGWLEREKVLLFWIEGDENTLLSYSIKIKKWRKRRLTVVTGTVSWEDVENKIADFSRGGGSFVAIDSPLVFSKENRSETNRRLEEIAEKYNVYMVTTEMIK